MSVTFLIFAFIIFAFTIFTLTGWQARLDRFLDFLNSVFSVLVVVGSVLSQVINKFQAAILNKLHWS